jgi:hypothetical protein
MKATGLVLMIGVLLVFAGCNPPAADDATAKKVAELEAKVAALEKRNNDLALKTRIGGSLFGSPLHNFFASDEFWENPYDSGQADCAKRCITALAAANKACNAKPDGPDKQNCFKDALDRASNCQKGCSASFPPQF